MAVMPVRAKVRWAQSILLGTSVRAGQTGINRIYARKIDYLLGRLHSDCYDRRRGERCKAPAFSSQTWAVVAVVTAPHPRVRTRPAQRLVGSPVPLPLRVLNEPP